jgi:hypothetical protein
MDRVDRLHEDLAFVDRMIAECQQHITRLQTATTVSDPQSTDLTNDVLTSFTAALTRYEAERSRVVSAIAGDRPMADLATDFGLSRRAAQQRKLLAE